MKICFLLWDEVGFLCYFLSVLVFFFSLFLSFFLVLFFWKMNLDVGMNCSVYNLVPYSLMHGARARQCLDLPRVRNSGAYQSTKECAHLKMKLILKKTAVSEESTHESF